MVDIKEQEIKVEEVSNVSTRLKSLMKCLVGNEILRGEETKYPREYSNDLEIGWRGRGGIGVCVKCGRGQSIQTTNYNSSMKTKIF